VEHRSGVALDRCPSCEGVWLDAGELERIVEAARRVAEARGDRVADLLVEVFARRTSPPK
jgi:Zn-finger nucleic acid-binding protein